MSHIARYGNNTTFNRKFDALLSYTAGGLILLFLCCLPLLASGCATAKVNGTEPSKPVISNIAVEDNSLMIAADQPFVYAMYKPGDPYKIIVDMPDTSIGVFNKRIVSHKRGITEVVPTQVESPSFLARLEILLETPSAIDQEYKNNILTIKIKNDMVVREASPKQPDPPKELTIPASDSKERALLALKVNDNVNQTLKPNFPKATEITNISFDASGGVVKILIQGNGTMTPNVFPLENRLVIDIADVVLNASMPVGVISPIRGIRSGRHDDKTRLVIDLKEMTKFDVAAIGESIVVTVQREREPAALATADQTAAETAPAYGHAPAGDAPEIASENKCQRYLDGKENINFDFQDQDIVPIFRLFADISGCNLFVHPDVKGTATMKFIDVSWIQALDTILKTFSLGKSFEGNIITIAPHSVFTRESEEKAKAREAISLAEPLETEIFNISYAQVKDVDAAIKNAKLLTPRGSTSVDERTSTILVQDTAAVFPKVQELLTTLDKPTPQVLIEARIVEVNIATTRDLGIQWGMNIQATNTLSSLGGLSGVPTLTPGAFTGNNYLVDFPAKNVGPLSGSGFTFGFLSPDRTFGLDLQLSAIETIGNGKVISNPRILTVDNGKAKILQGKSIPVRKLTAEGTVSTEFKDVTMELNVVPHITPDKSVGMAIEIKKEELDPTVPSIEGVPGTDKKEANTNVIVKDGETIVIGGMYKISTSDSDSGVPGLMNIPILGWLFKNNTKTSTTNELLIFITPRIVEKP
jgi:type IV pilus assembly protein PilQ